MKRAREDDTVVEQELVQDQPTVKREKPALLLTLPKNVPQTCTISNRTLDQKNRHPRDFRIFFDEEPHDYYVDWKGDGTFTRDMGLSVTSFVKLFFSPFNPDAAILNIYNGKNYCSNKDYFGKTPEEIKAIWNDRRERGTACHAMIEDFYNDGTPPETCKEMSLFQNFHEDTKDQLEPFRSEWFIFTDDETRICGSLDMLFVNTMIMETLWQQVEFGANAPDTLHVCLYDWKVAKNISKFMPGGKYAKGPCSGYSDTNYYQYALQLNTYKYIMENFCGNVVWKGKTYKNIHVDVMALVQLYNTQRKYKRIPVGNMQKTVKAMMEMRRESLALQRRGEPGLWPFDATQPEPEPEPVRVQPTQIDYDTF